MGSLFERKVQKLSSSTTVITTKNKNTGKVSRSKTTKVRKPRKSKK